MKTLSINCIKIMALLTLCYITETSSLAQANTNLHASADVIVTDHYSQNHQKNWNQWNGLHTRFKSRDHFVRTLLPHAIKAGKILGVDPKVILAQAALETNWGQSILKNKDKQISHNIFAIKGSNTKQSNSFSTRTKEFRNGKLIREKQSFRSYNNFVEAFSDYTRIIQKAHYKKHMRNLRTPADYAMGLQRAGYATDPKYAKKIMQKYRDPSLAKIQI